MEVHEVPVLPHGYTAFVGLWLLTYLCVLGSFQQPEEAECDKQEAGVSVDSVSWISSMVVVVWMRGTVCVRLQTGSVGHDMSHIVLLFYPMEQVRHGAFGIDGNVFSPMSLRVQRDGRLLHVLLVNWKADITCKQTITAVQPPLFVTSATYSAPHISFKGTFSAWTFMWLFCESNPVLQTLCNSCNLT